MRELSNYGDLKKISDRLRRKQLSSVTLKKNSSKFYVLISLQSCFKTNSSILLPTNFYYTLRKCVDESKL